MTETKVLDLRQNEASSKAQTHNLNDLLKKLKHQIKSDYHLIRELPDDDKINFLLKFYPRDQIYKDENKD